MELSFFLRPVSPPARTNLDDVGQSVRLEWMPACNVSLHMRNCIGDVTGTMCQRMLLCPLPVPPFPLVHMIAASFLTLFLQTHNSLHLFHFHPNLVTAFSYLPQSTFKPSHHSITFLPLQRSIQILERSSWFRMLITLFPFINPTIFSGSILLIVKIFTFFSPSC